MTTTTSSRIVTIAPASVARQDLYTRMADMAYGDYLSAHVAYTEALGGDRGDARAWQSRVRGASAKLATSREVMRLVLELGGFRLRPADAEDCTLDPVAWYEKHLLGGL